MIQRSARLVAFIICITLVGCARQAPQPQLISRTIHRADRNGVRSVSITLRYASDPQSGVTPGDFRGSVGYSYVSNLERERLNLRLTPAIDEPATVLAFGEGLTEAELTTQWGLVEAAFAPHQVLWTAGDHTGALTIDNTIIGVYGFLDYVAPTTFLQLDSETADLWQGQDEVYIVFTRGDSAEPLATLRLDRFFLIALRDVIAAGVSIRAGEPVPEEIMVKYPQG